MKTLIVLYALVSITIAAPALPGDGFDEFAKTTTDIPELMAREKKSPAHNTDFIEAAEHGTTSDGHSHDIAASSGTGRSFGFKKPIIVKKKVGYPLYRDSDEEKEQSDSRESCKEQVKVKLCNDKSISKSSDMLRSTTVEDIDDHNMSKDEMTHSLKIAKEAIENLERDLHKSQKSGMTVEKKNEHFENDSVIHKDIDAARQALEHIHRNFENFDSMSLHTTTSKDAESLHDVHLTIAKTEEERMAQWKQAIDNIQKNAEIARNIEDSFKSTTQELSAEDLQAMNVETIHGNSNHHKISVNEDNMRSTKNTEPNKTKLDDEKQCKSKSVNEEIIQKNANGDEKFEDDMHPSASTVTEIKLNDLNNEKKLSSDHVDTEHIEKMAAANQTDHLKGILKQNVESKNEFTDHSPQARNSEFDSTKDEKFHPAQLETDKDKTQRKTNEENTFDAEMTHSIGKMKSATVNQAIDCNDSLDKKDTNEKSALENSKDNNHKTNISTGQLKVTNGHDTLKKSAEHFFEIENKEIETSDFPMKSFDHIETSFQESMGQSEDFMRTKTDHSDNQQALPSELKPLHAHTNAAMKSVGSFSPGQSKDLSSFQRSQDKSPKVETTSLRAASELRKDFRTMDKPANTHFSNSHHMTGFGANGHMHHMHPHESRVHDQLFHNTDSTMPTMNMRDATGNFGVENNMFRWKPNHEIARTAYGPAIAPAVSAGSSAVGMFPNANIGNCAVPILLSCSPSVTQGNLAKALPVGYGAPAYRTEDDFSIFPNKREIKKTNEIPGDLAKNVLVNFKEKPAADIKQ